MRRSIAMSEVLASYRDDETPARAIAETRCIKAPMGCGKALLNEDGSRRYDSFPDRETARLYEAEWRITGLCPDCQDEDEAKAKELWASEGEWVEEEEEEEEEEEIPGAEVVVVVETEKPKRSRKPGIPVGENIPPHILPSVEGQPASTLRFSDGREIAYGADDGDPAA